MNRIGFLLFIIVNAISLILMSESQGFFSVIVALLILYFNVGMIKLNKCREGIEKCETEGDIVTTLEEKQREKELNKVYILSSLFMKVADYFYKKDNEQ